MSDYEIDDNATLLAWLRGAGLCRKLRYIPIAFVHLILSRCFRLFIDTDVTACIEEEPDSSYSRGKKGRKTLVIRIVLILLVSYGGMILYEAEPDVQRLLKEIQERMFV